MTLRKVFFWMHLCAGSTAGLVVLIMSVTGVLLAYERQINAWADSGFWHPAPSAIAVHLPVETLLSASKEKVNATPTALTLKSDREAPAALEIGRQRMVYLNPYTGEVLGEGAQGTRVFFQQVEQWHRFLAFSGASRATARTVTGVANLLFFFLVCSGIYLWWPRAWTRQYLRPVVWFRGGLRGKARDWNWHHVIGIWCAAPLFFIVLSGIVMSFPWANRLLFRMTGNEAPVQQGPGGGGAGREGGGRQGGGGREGREAQPGRRGGGEHRSSFDGLNALWARAEQQDPHWRSISMRLPGGGKAPVSFAIDAGDGGRPDLRSTLTLDRKTAAVVSWETFSSFNLGRQLRSWVRFGHTGEAGGMVGETVAALASLGAAFLVWTGLALALRRFAAARARKTRHAAVLVAD
jgi:uncharacterized iron-regulated membrane protein